MFNSPFPGMAPLPGTDLGRRTQLRQVYHHGRYDDIDYTLPPVPPLEAEDAAWADELLRAAGKRPAIPV